MLLAGAELALVQDRMEGDRRHPPVVLCWAMLQATDSAPLFEPFRTAGMAALEAYTDADAAVARIAAIYDKGVTILREAFARFTAGDPPDRLGPIDAYYPFLGIRVDRQSLNLDARRSFGALHDPGVYGTTLTRPALFREY